MNVAHFATLFNTEKIKSHRIYLSLKKEKKNNVPASLILSSTLLLLFSLKVLRAETKPHCSKNYNHKTEEKEKIWKREWKGFLLKV